MNDANRKKYKMRFLRFLATGGLNTLIDFSILNILVYIFSIPKAGYEYAIFKGISFSVAVINSYVLNKYWVFRHQAVSTWKEKSTFFVVSVIGLLINTLISTTVFKVLSLFNEPTFIAVNGSAVVGSLCVFIGNYFGYKKFVFRTI